MPSVPCFYYPQNPGNNWNHCQNHATLTDPSPHGKLYLLRRWISGYESSSVLSLELAEGKWNLEPDIPGMVVRLPELACVDSSIYLLDVRNDCRLLHLDLNSHTWNSKTKPPRLFPIGIHMIAVKGQLFVTGGADRNLAWYNPTTDAWTTGNPSTIIHHLGALVHLDEKVYLIGGRRKTALRSMT